MGSNRYICFWSCSRTILTFHLNRCCGTARHVNRKWCLFLKDNLSRPLSRKKTSFQMTSILSKDIIFSSKWYQRTSFKYECRNYIYSYVDRMTLTTKNVFWKDVHSHKSPPKWTTYTWWDYFKKDFFKEVVHFTIFERSPFSWKSSVHTVGSLFTAKSAI